MLEEQSGSVSQENSGQEVQNDNKISGHNIDDSLNQEKAYSQKQRKRAQSAESELEKLQARQKKMEEDAMVEQNKFKELWEKDKEDAEKYRSYKTKHRASLLERIPEDKRENFKNWGIEQLETYVSDVFKSDSQGETMKAVHGQVDVPSPDKPWSNMSEEEKRAFYQQAEIKKSI
tara:strand:- start:6236 stop:6760 length:525 start_codon:yes stop_codon:yes gene_type:complete